MSSLAERALALFVSPPTPVAGSAAWEPPLAMRPSPRDDTSGHLGVPWAPGPGTAVVLGPSGAAVPVAAVLANALRARARARTALLIVWAPSQVAPIATVPAWPAARRMAERFKLAEPSAGARGWLVRVDIPPAPEAAAARIPELTSGEVPAVIVLAGPRPAAFDPFLAAAERVVLVADPDRPPGATALAAQQLARLGSAVSVMPPVGSPVARALAGAGLGRLRRLEDA